MITPAMAASAKSKFERTHRPYQGGSFNQGPLLAQSATAVAAVIEESSDILGNEGDVKENENLGIVTMTWPSAIALGDSDSDDSVSPPFTVLNLYWDAGTPGCDGFFHNNKGNDQQWCSHCFD